MWNVKYDTNEPICETGIETQRISWWLPRESGVEKSWIGIWDQQMKTGLYRMDKQGPTVQHRNNIQYPGLADANWYVQKG